METQHTQQTTTRTAQNQDVVAKLICRNTQKTRRNMKQIFIKGKMGVLLWNSQRQKPLKVHTRI